MKTRNILLGVMISGISLMQTACYDDEGNYDYRDINQIDIGFEKTAYEVTRYNELTVTPAVSFSRDQEQKSYEYLWILETPGTTIKQNDTLSYDPVLKKTITVKSGVYNLCLAVIDPETKVTFRNEVKLSVTTEITQGYLLLCEEGGTMALDMLARVSLLNDDPTNFKLLKQMESSLPRLEKPKSIRYSMYAGMDEDWNDVYYYFSGIVTEGHLIHLDENLDLDPRLDVNKHAAVDFGEPFNPQLDFYMGGNECFFVNGDFCTRTVGYVEGTFGAPANSAQESYKLYPDLMGFNTNVKQAMYYDITNKRFMYYKSGDILSAFQPPAGPEDYYNIGKTMLYMYGPCYHNNGYAVTRGPGELDFDLYVYSGTKAATATPVIYPLDDLTGIKDAKFFDVPQGQPYLYYATETDVYQVNYDLGKSTLQHVFSATNGKIVQMKFNRFTSDNSYDEGVDRLLVCVNASGDEATCGELHIFAIQEGNVKPVEFGSFSGIRKIVDITYKEQ